VTQNTFVQKAACKMLVKLTIGVNFINVLQAAFAHADPKVKKRQSIQQLLFALLGSAQVKDAHKMLVKLTEIV